MLPSAAACAALTSDEAKACPTSFRQGPFGHGGVSGVDGSSCSASGVYEAASERIALELGQAARPAPGENFSGGQGIEEPLDASIDQARAELRAWLLREELLEASAAASAVAAASAAAASPAMVAAAPAAAATSAAAGAVAAADLPAAPVHAGTLRQGLARGSRFEQFQELWGRMQRFARSLDPLPPGRPHPGFDSSRKFEIVDGPEFESLTRRNVYWRERANMELARMNSMHDCMNQAMAETAYLRSEAREFNARFLEHRVRHDSILSELNEARGSRPLQEQGHRVQLLQRVREFQCRAAAIWEDMPPCMADPSELVDELGLEEFLGEDVLGSVGRSPREVGQGAAFPTVAQQGVATSRDGQEAVTPRVAEGRTTSRAAGRDASSAEAVAGAFGRAPCHDEPAAATPRASGGVGGGNSTGSFLRSPGVLARQSTVLAAVEAALTKEVEALFGSSDGSDDED